jgi:hypothetical protein
MTKVLLNKSYGGFGLSDKAFELYLNRSGIAYFKEDYDGVIVYKTSNPDEDLYADEISRKDPILIKIVEELGEEANSYHSDLYIDDIPPGTFYNIVEYDGMECIHTPDMYGWEVA